jgi:DNA modification methylase
MEQNLTDLTPDPKNARKHGARNVEAIVAALQEVGAARSIVIDEDGTILAGNATVEAAAAAGLTRVKVVDTEPDTLVAVRRTGLTAAQKARLALYDNRAAELAEGWHDAVLKELQASGVSLDGLWTAAELADLLAAGTHEGLTDPDAIPELRPTSIVAGDLFELGRHRLLCGDSTRGADVARLLGNVKPILMVTDPPYGVEYDPSWRAKAGVNKNRQKLGTVANDGQADWTPAWELFPGDIAYVWHAGRRASEVQASIECADFEIRSQVIWRKDRFALSRGHYHWQHEPCWYAVRKGKTGRWSGDRSQTTVWDIPAREDGGHGHGTQKPVECMSRPMRNHDAPDVYEPFSGSGTSIIAAEQLGRACYAMEITPAYVQMAVDRWEAFTGQKARKVGGA